MTAAAYFATALLGQKLKLKILCEKLLIVSQHFFGILPFGFYTLADGICNISSRSSLSPPAEPTSNFSAPAGLNEECPVRFALY